MNDNCNAKYLDRQLALKYLGGRNQSLPEIEKCERLLCEAARPRFVFRIFERNSCPVELIGKDISDHIEGCEKVVLFAATLGVKVDDLTRKQRLFSMTEAFVTDCCASAMIERFCEDCDRQLAEKLSGQFLTWRYSPGYGDFPIETQKMLLAALNAQKLIGLYSTDSMMLLPQKSITAVIGVSSAPVSRDRRGCEYCSMKESCVFRKEGVHCE